MIYYILFPGDTEEDCINDANQLGHMSFGKFHPNEGLNVLRDAINNFEHLLPSIKIIDSNSKHYTIEEFLDIVGKL
jgi:hypothetical protein